MLIAHISDLHFSKISYNPLQIFSKRWVGNANLILSRNKTHTKEPLKALEKVLLDLKVDLIVAAGDLSTTSLVEEFSQAKSFFKQTGKNTLFVPGNHDKYTKKSARDKTFYTLFKNPASSFGLNYSLSEDGLEVGSLMDKWAYICLDTTIATNIFSSRGLFSIDLEKKLKKAIDIIPDNFSIMIITHYPLFQNDSVRKKLLRAVDLQQLLQKSPKVKLYLHGHTHRHCIADLRASNYPIVLDSGSCSHIKKGTFQLLDLKKDKVDIQVFGWMNNSKWKERSKIAFCDL